jgi:hypothetical protein
MCSGRTEMKLVINQYMSGMKRLDMKNIEITLPQWHKDVGYSVHFLALFLIPNELFWVSFTYVLMCTRTHHLSLVEK